MPVHLSNKLKSLLHPSTPVVAFTGAGVSVESGIPSFRGKDGLWNRYRAEDLATYQAFQANPKLVWDWYNSRRENMLKVEPNRGHHALARFEEYFNEFVLVTQNIDGLHQRAGNHQLLKLHGDIWEVRCLECGLTRMDYTVPLEPTPPHCPCGGLLRVGVVWFGETLPMDVYEKALEKTRKSQLFFSIGTSAVVYPAAYLPQIARDSGAYVVEINIEPSAMVDCCDELLLGPAGEVLPAIAAGLN
jgi:NAD-dependent deacetylase